MTPLNALKTNEPSQIFSRINDLTFHTRETVFSKQTHVLKRGKKKYYHFLYPVTYLNRRKSPSATLVSKEIETVIDPVFFQRSRFFPKSQNLLKVMEVGGIRRVGE